MHRFVRLFAFALAAGLLGMAPALAQTVITLGISGLSEGKLPIYAAEQQGLFKAAGIAVDIQEFRSGGDVVQAFVGGSVDFCICAADHAITLTERGLDVKLLAGLDAHFPNALVSRPGAPPGTLAALRGRKIGITSPGSSTDNLLRWALKKAGLDPDGDVDIVSVGTGPAMRTAILSGAVDAGIIGNAELIEAARAGRPFTMVADWRTVEDAALNVIAHQQWVDAHHDVAVAFVKAVVRGAKLIQSDPAVAIAATHLIFPERDDGFNAALAASGAAHVSKDGSVSEVGFRNALEILMLADPDVKPLALSSVNLQPVLAR
jgi:NitT/TauT family transport system substrate-binding protein